MKQQHCSPRENNNIQRLNTLYNNLSLLRIIFLKKFDSRQNNRSLDISIDFYKRGKKFSVDNKNWEGPVTKTTHIFLVRHFTNNIYSSRLSWCHIIIITWQYRSTSHRVNISNLSVLFYAHKNNLWELIVAIVFVYFFVRPTSYLLNLSSEIDIVDI
jgi:hypothetical protein